MAERLSFHLVSPERELFSGQVDQVVVPGTEGDFGVLPRHAPLMSAIRPGAITIMDGDARRRVFVLGGFADVTPDGLTILAEEATPVDDLDAAATAEALRDARSDLNDARDDDERARVSKAIARLEAIEAVLAG